MKEGIKRADVEWGTQQPVRRPLSWKTHKRNGRGRQGVGRREAVWIGLALPYHMLLRASELFTDDCRVHDAF